LSPAKRVRWQPRMSQSEFANTFRIPLATLRDWERHRQEPDEHGSGLSGSHSPRA
jgi:putative transcriptional regulator